VRAMKLLAMGFDPWFQERRIDENPEDDPVLDMSGIARVIIVNRDQYIVRNEEEEIPAEITGKIMFTAGSPLDYPTVGDWVQVQYFDNGAFAIIRDIFPRKSVLKRKTSGKKIEFQLVAANIDTAFIVQSLDDNFNLRRLERYLVMINESKIHPVILLSKKDLVSQRVVEEKTHEIQNTLKNVRVVSFSNVTGSGIDDIKRHLLSGQTYCLVGSSGVGKTTLLNYLLQDEKFKTRPVRAGDGKGRHATTRRQLIFLENGAMLIDTPGMRELGNIGGESGLEDTFNEISDLTTQCRFNDCSHTGEDGCAVLAAVKDQSISKKRYENYIKMTRELQYNAMSYLDKRRKDKKFGKLIKSVMKYKNNEAP